MNAENIQGCQDMGAQVILKRLTPGKSGEIFTLEFKDSRQDYAVNSQPAFKSDDMGRGAGCPRMVADECGPDLFFELWDFSDTPQKIEPA